MPIRLGGFGLSSVKSVSPCAFLASWVQAFVCLPILFSNLKSFIDSFLASPSEFPTSIVLRSLIPAASKLSDYFPENNKLQKKLSSELAESSLNNVLKVPVSMRDAARFCSLTGKGAGAWISAVPSSVCFVIDSCVYRLVCKLRLGFPVYSSEWLRSCECGAALDDTEVWADCLRKLHLPCRREPRHRYSNSEDRPDIVSLDPSSGLGIDLNISLAHPWSGEIFPSSANIDGAAAKRREEKKKLKYKGKRFPDGEQVILKPLVLRHFS